MFGLKQNSMLREAQAVWEALTFETEELIGNGEGSYIAYCVQDPSFYYVCGDPDEALEGLKNDLFASIFGLIGYNIEFEDENVH